MTSKHGKHVHARHEAEQPPVARTERREHELPKSSSLGPTNRILLKKITGNIAVRKVRQDTKPAVSKPEELERRLREDDPFPGAFASPFDTDNTGYDDYRQIGLRNTVDRLAAAERARDIDRQLRENTD